MNDAEAPIVVDPQFRAALLWDVPALQRSEGGAQQWHRALRLEFVRVGEMDVEDPLSIAAHLVQAVLVGNNDAIPTSRSQMADLGEAARLFAGLVALWLELDPPDALSQTLSDVGSLVRRVEDSDLRARLLLRLAVFSHHLKQRPEAVMALNDALDITTLDTRLGVVVRRWAVSEGIDIPDFNPYLTTNTPDDPLVTLPWVRADALVAAAAVSSDRLEQHLRGVWDTKFHLGRTTLDELVAAQTQAEWCGASDLRNTARRLVAPEILLDTSQSAEQTRWALAVWATTPQAKAVPTVIRARESSLDALAAANLLSEVRRDGTAGWSAYIQVAAGVWDLLDEEGCRDLLAALTGSEAEYDNPEIVTVLANLLWRVPDAWADVFSVADEPTRAAMLGELDPYHLDVIPPGLLHQIAEYRAQTGGDFSAFDFALAFRERGEVVTTASLSPNAVVTLVRWRRESVAPQVVTELVQRVEAQTRSALEAARERSFTIGDAGTRILGALGAYMPEPPVSVFELLVEVCEDRDAAASWQFGALESLAMLGHAGCLGQAEIERVRSLDISPGGSFFGEQISRTLLRAMQMRVYAKQLNNDEITWLATCSRGNDAQARLAAIVALGDIEDEITPTVEWALVSGLFDPAEDVVIRAVGELEGRTSSSPDAAAVESARLRDLYRDGDRRIRQAVVRTARKRPDLKLDDLVESAQGDRAWTVRRQALEDGS